MSEPPALELVFEARVRVGPALRDRPGRRPLAPYRADPRRRGERTPAAGDGAAGRGGIGQVVEEDGLTNLTARYIIQAADGTLISVSNQGVRHGPPDVIRRMLAGQAVEPGSYLFPRGARFRGAVRPA